MNTTKLNRNPKSWSDITVSEFQEINNLDTTKDEYSTHLLSIITDTSLDVIEEFDYDEFLEIFSKFDFYQKNPKSTPKQKINLIDTDLHLIDLNKMTLGEFIDLEHFFVDGPMKNLSIILAILYRKKEVLNSAFHQDVFEEYGDYIYHRQPIFEEAMIGDVYGVIPSYMKFRKDLFDSYEGLFDDSDVDDEMDEDMDVISRAEFAKNNSKEKLLKKWGWDMLIFKLSNNDATRVDKVYKMNIIMAFNILSMQKELQL